MRLSIFMELVEALGIDLDNAEVWIEAPAGASNPVSALRQLGRNDVILTSTVVESHRDEDQRITDLLWLLNRIGSWTNARWDQHLRNEFGDERADAVLRLIGDGNIRDDCGL